MHTYVQCLHTCVCVSTSFSWSVRLLHAQDTPGFPGASGAASADASVASSGVASPVKAMTAVLTVGQYGLGQDIYCFS